MSSLWFVVRCCSLCGVWCLACVVCCLLVVVCFALTDVCCLLCGRCSLACGALFGVVGCCVMFVAVSGVCC